MKKLIQGIVNFRKNLTQEDKALFKKLSTGQKPDALFIGCSDSRIPINFFASTDPGDLFILRNIGNLIPPISSQDTSVSAALEFSIFSLNISDIIICGHSECGAMQALSKGIDTLHQPHLKSWLKYGKESLNQLKKGSYMDSSLSQHNQLSQINVLQQMKHIATYPFIHERLEKKQLQIHGWWFDIAKANVYFYEKNRKQFILIDENNPG